MKYSNKNLYPFLLLLIQPIFMASNLVVARGGIEFVPPISLSFWRWSLVFLILLLFNFFLFKKKLSQYQKRIQRIIIFRSNGMWRL